MSSQNLISATLADETKTEVLNALTAIKGNLDFLLSLQTDDIQAIFKPGAGYMPFIDLVNTVVSDHPEILPRTFNITEFKKDYELSKSLAPIVLKVGELNEGLQRTFMAVNSDAMATSLDVYGVVKLNRDKVSGLNVVADQMGAFFQKTSRKTSPPVSTVTV